MIEKSRVCVLIPAYNEEKNIERVVKGVSARGWAVLVVDDGSSDSTAEKVRALGVPAVFSAANEGKGASIQKGIDWILETHYTAAVLMDADGQHRVEEIEVFVEALVSGADLVVGNRMADPKGMPTLRVATNRFMSWLISLAAGQKVPDSQCGFRALSRRAMQAVRLETARFESESEMILKAAKADLRIHSVAVGSVYGGETSHIRPVRDTVRFFKFLLQHLLRR